jgi:hypothetical protein
MIDYRLALCYGIIVSFEKMQEFQEVLTEEEYCEMLDNYSNCVNSWTGEDYFIGTMSYFPDGETDFVYRVPTFSIPSDDDEDLINFKRFFDEHNLWGFIDWKPELLLINFCF